MNSNLNQTCLFSNQINVFLLMWSELCSTTVVTDKQRRATLIWMRPSGILYKKIYGAKFMTLQLIEKWPYPHVTLLIDYYNNCTCMIRSN